MIVKVTSSTVVGIDSHPVDVEVDISPGLPQFSTVGLPDAAVRESKDRIKAAIKNSGYRFPRNHVTVNLAPADIRKEGTGFDLPIAVGILTGEGCIESDKLPDYIFIGELSLDGSIKGVDGVLPAALVRPALTTIKQPIQQLGRTAFELAVQSALGAIAEPREVVFDPVVVERDSV